jgi:hypothetical protein
MTPAELAEVRTAVVWTASELYRMSEAATAGAYERLVEFDRQSEGALASASEAVRLAQACCNARRATQNTPSGFSLAQFEALLALAQGRQEDVLRYRNTARAPLEIAWAQSATQLCLYGNMLLAAAERQPVVTSTPASTDGRVIEALEGTRPGIVLSDPPNGTPCTVWYRPGSEQ